MATKKSSIQIAKRLKQSRSSQNLTQAALAKKAGISTNYYARIERGDTGISVAILESLVRALKVKSSDILPF